MRYVTYIVAIATLAGAVTGCADPYYPRSGYSQANYSTPGYSYPAKLTTALIQPDPATIRPATATDRITTTTATTVEHAPVRRLLLPFPSARDGHIRTLRRRRCRGSAERPQCLFAVTPRGRRRSAVRRHAALPKTQYVADQRVALRAAERKIGHVGVCRGQVPFDRSRRNVRLGGDCRKARHPVGSRGARFAFDDVATHAPTFGQRPSEGWTLRGRRQRRKRQYYGQCSRTRFRTCSSAPKMLTRRDRKSCRMVIADNAARGGIAGALTCAPVVVPAISMAYRQKDAEEFRARWLYCRPLRTPLLAPVAAVAVGFKLVISDFVVQIYRCCLASSAIRSNIMSSMSLVPVPRPRSGRAGSDGSRAVRMSECPSLACLLSPHVSQSVTLINRAVASMGFCLGRHERVHL